MQTVFAQYLALIPPIWWPFCRLLAAFSLSPFIGEAMVPMRARVALALLLAVASLPTLPPLPDVHPFSLYGLAVTLEQLIVGLLFGLAFQLVMAALSLLGFLLSSQMGLSMAAMNDPGTGNTSDVVSNLLYLLAAMIFFAMDGHLLLLQILQQSFHTWPVGSGVPGGALTALAGSVGWVLSAAVLLALPAVLATFVVQMGFGMINRVAPALNLFSLGFPVVTLFGLATLTLVMQVLPSQYQALNEQLLRLLGNMPGAARG